MCFDLISSCYTACFKSWFGPTTPTQVVTATTPRIATTQPDLSSAATTSYLPQSTSTVDSTYQRILKICQSNITPQQKEEAIKALLDDPNFDIAQYTSITGNLLFDLIRLSHYFDGIALFKTYFEKYGSIDGCKDRNGMQASWFSKILYAKEICRKDLCLFLLDKKKIFSPIDHACLITLLAKDIIQLTDLPFSDNETQSAYVTFNNLLSTLKGKNVDISTKALEKAGRALGFIGDTASCEKFKSDFFIAKTPPPDIRMDAHGDPTVEQVRKFSAVFSEPTQFQAAIVEANKILEERLGQNTRSELSEYMKLIEHGYFILMPGKGADAPFHIPLAQAENVERLNALAKKILISLRNWFYINFDIDLEAYLDYVDAETADAHIKDKKLFYEANPVIGFPTHGAISHLLQLLMMFSVYPPYKIQIADLLKMIIQTPSDHASLWNRLFDQTMDEDANRSAYGLNAYLMLEDSMIGQITRLFYDLAIFKQAEWSKLSVEYLTWLSILHRGLLVSLPNAPEENTPQEIDLTENDTDIFYPGQGIARVRTEPKAEITYL